MNNILRAQNIFKIYSMGLNKKASVLKNVSLEIEKGEIVSLIGLNGAGKTTLLKILVGINNPTKGTVALYNRPVQESKNRQRLGFMPENPQFYNNLEAVSFLQMIAGLFGKSPKKSYQKSIKLLAEVGLKNSANKKIGTFSKGMRQRLGFAQSLIGDPDILFLDEPLDGLDPLGRKELKDSILKRKKDGCTVILCSHILSDIAEMSDRIGILDQGKLIAVEKNSSLIGKNKTLEEAFIKKIKK